VHVGEHASVASVRPRAARREVGAVAQRLAGPAAEEAVAVGSRHVAASVEPSARGGARLAPPHAARRARTRAARTSARASLLAQPCDGRLGGRAARDPRGGRDAQSAEPAERRARLAGRGLRRESA
jgi:hypothetical protein